MRSTSGRPYPLAPTLLILAAASLCGAAGETVARIGDRVLSVEAFEAEALALRKTGYKDIRELDDAAKRRLLDGIIARELLLLEGRHRGLDRDSTVVEEVARTEQRALMTRLYETQAVQPEYTFTEDELRRFFVDAHYDVEVLSRHIVCATEAEARQVLAALADSVPFETLVQLHSRPNIQSLFGPGGWVGWFKLGDVFDELREPLSTMAPGTIWPEPVKTTIGYHVFGLKDRRPVAFEADPKWVREKMRVQRRADDMERYVQTLRERYGLVAHPEALRALAAVPAEAMTWSGPDRPLFTWTKGQLTIADYLAQLRAGRARHPAGLDSAQLYQAADNLAGRQVMAAEAHRLGLEADAQVRGKVVKRQNELIVEGLFRAETGKRPVGTFTEDDARAFYDRNLGLFTRADGKVTEFAFLRNSILTLLRNQAESAAMDAFIAELRAAYGDRIAIYPEALALTFAGGAPPSK